MSLSDQMPGGFDQFKAEFHRLHTEILATGVADAITPRELKWSCQRGNQESYRLDDGVPPDLQPGPQCSMGGYV